MESSSTSKRARAPGNISQIAHCLVDGCNADLSQCREYHRRHKVCEQHSKTPRVTIAGREQRFCQQCSRFHSLVEFDEGKRSCRKRLDGHNRRRRKPQPELSRSPGMLFSGQQGTRILSFGTPQIYPSAAVSSNWTGSVKPENEVKPENDVAPFHSQSSVHYLDRQPNMYQESSSSSSQFQFLQSSNRGSNVCQPLLDPDLASSGRQKMFSGDGGLNQVINSGHRALSLLSSAPVPATREIGFSSRMVQPDSSMSQLHSLHQQYGNNHHHHHHHQSHSHSHSHSHSQFHFGQEMESSRTKPVVSENDSQTSNNATLHFQEMFHNHNNTSLHSSSAAGGGSHQTLTFLWE